MYHRGLTVQSWIFALNCLVLHNLCLLDMNRYTLLIKTEETQMYKQRKRQRELVQFLREALSRFCVLLMESQGCSLSRTICSLPSVSPAAH